MKKIWYVFLNQSFFHQSWCPFKYASCQVSNHSFFAYEHSNYFIPVLGIYTEMWLIHCSCSQRPCSLVGISFSAHLTVAITDLQDLCGGSQMSKKSTICWWRLWLKEARVLISVSPPSCLTWGNGSSGKAGEKGNFVGEHLFLFLLPLNNT